jgi:hypothetical protein
MEALNAEQPQQTPERGYFYPPKDFSQISGSITTISEQAKQRSDGFSVTSNQQAQGMSLMSSSKGSAHMKIGKETF